MPNAVLTSVQMSASLPFGGFSMLLTWTVSDHAERAGTGPVIMSNYIRYPTF